MELINKTVFILGATKFDGSIASTSFATAKFLAKKNDVYYVDFPFTYKDFLNRDLKAFMQRRKPFFKKRSDGIIKTEDPRLSIVILPLLLSINFLPENRLYRMLLSWNERLIADRINHVIRKFNLKDCIFINSFNFHYPNIGRLIGARLSVYHSVDPLIVGYDMKHGFVSENIVVSNSDLVVCTSKQLTAEKKQVNKNTFFIPNAADLTLSSRALDPTLEIHPLLKDIPRPIVGYFGNIERRMNFELLKIVALENADKSFVFVGPVSEGFVTADFSGLKNVFFLGAVNYHEMPSVVKGFDVAIIPFKKDAVSNTIFPLKLFEYLGAGKAVVATDFNLDLREFTRNVVAYCASAAEFSVALNKQIAEDGAAKQSLRIAVAKENTWEIRLTQLSELLNQFYISKFEN